MTPKTTCDFCDEPLDNYMFAVKMDDDIYCGYCFKMAHPNLYLYFGGENMMGSYTLEVRRDGEA